jgi:hypothetical protein
MSAITAFAILILSAIAIGTTIALFLLVAWLLD